MDSEIQVISSVEDIKDRVYWIRGKQVMLTHFVMANDNQLIKLAKRVLLLYS